MAKNNKATKIAELLGRGLSPSQIKARMKVSASYIFKVKSDLEKAARDALSEMAALVEEDRNGRPCNNDCGPNSVSDPTNVNGILNERHDSYGAFYGVAALSQNFKTVMMGHLNKHNKTLIVDQAEALDMIFSKIARIVNGDADNVDSWVDIAGYAQLVADRLQGKVR